jgi:hypothetical protein
MFFYCRSYCLLNMFQTLLCPSSRAREYYTSGCCLWYLVLWFSSFSNCRYGAAAARKPDTQPSAPHHTDNLKTKAPNTTGSNHLYNTLELLMMGIIVPETCWSSNKICNKKHLLHIVAFYFHILTTMHSQNHFEHILGVFNVTAETSILMYYTVFPVSAFLKAWWWLAITAETCSRE